MEISVVSSLTPEDESKLAAALMSALGGVLDLLPIAYSIRVETVSGKSYDRIHSPSATDPLETIAPSTRAALLDFDGPELPRPLSRPESSEPVGPR
jgi:hypothetical protein